MRKPLARVRGLIEEYIFYNKMDISITGTTAQASLKRIWPSSITSELT
jgi:hypothetical protein